MKFLALFFIVFSLCGLSFAQSDEYIVLNKVFITGNKRTVDRIILRELDLKEGDTVLRINIDTVLKINRNRIYNTRLFNEVKLTFLPDSSFTNNLLIEVTERWYIFPVPIFELADRSFNEWWYNQNRSLNRINYGIRFTDKNFRGRKEELSLTVQGGFTQKLELKYHIPYINKLQTWGTNVDFGFDQNKQTSYATIKNKQVFIRKENEILRERYRAGISFDYRKFFFGTHSFSLYYNYASIADSITILNPDYFGNGKKYQQFLQLSYYFTFDKRDIRAYAHKGYYFKFSYDQKGFMPFDDIKIASFDLTYGKYLSLGRNFYLASLSKGKVYIADNIPYYNRRAFGYDQDYVRGYDLYVIDAQNFLLQRITLRKKIIETDLNIQSLLPIKQFSSIPLSLYLNTYYDLGYGYLKNPEATGDFLSNDLLRGGGIGLDLVTYYDSVIRFEYSINKMLERRIYLAFTKDI